MSNIFGTLSTEFTKSMADLGEKSFRAKQVSDWIFNKKITDFDAMTNLSVTLRKKLKENYSLALPTICKRLVSQDGTKKYLLDLADNEKIEMVLIPSEDKNTLCISSQVGCGRGCKFCATASIGFIRNLLPHEICGQVYLALTELGDDKLTNIVCMGMGEPLDNYNNLIKSLKILQESQRFAISPRRITVSTCGIIEGIRKLATCGLKVKLAVSLNSAIEETRRSIMPISYKNNLASLKDAIVYFRSYSPYRVTFEYIMIKHFNMGNDDIKAIKKFAGDISCKINLIKWNHVQGLDWKTPNDADIDTFMEKLKVLSAAITFRKSRGTDIAAACGQLVSKKTKQEIVCKTSKN